jgi:hypothetical protein
MGSTMIANTGNMATASGDENFLNKNNAKNTLKGALGGSSLSASTNTLTSLSSMSGNVNGAVITHHQHSSAASLLPASQSYNALTTANSLRNVLGDIGNRIGLANVQAGALNKKDKPVEAIVAPLAKPEPPAVVVSEVVVTTLVAKQDTLTVANTTCVMEEVDDEDSDSGSDEDEEVLDIDKHDIGNTQLVPEYVNDVYAYLSDLEKLYRVSPDFLGKKIVTSKMRSVLIDWLIQVHLKFQLLQETLYLCVQIIDAYLLVR